MLPLVLTLVTSLSPDASPKPEPPAPRTTVSPEYPSLARQARVEGTVVILLDVDEAGTPRVVAVKQGLPLLEDAARAAVVSWRYPSGAPGRRDAIFDFVLTDSRGDADPAGEAPPEALFEAPNRMRVVAPLPCVWWCGPAEAVCIPQKALPTSPRGDVWDDGRELESKRSDVPGVGTPLEGPP